MDAIEAYQYNHGYINNPEYDDIIKRGGYKGKEKWQMDLMKFTSIIFPNYSINNIYKNFSNSSNISSATFYNNQWPLNTLNYLPDRRTGA
jgi:hypothetical protein